MIERQKSSPTSPFDRNTKASPVAITTPRRPSHTAAAPISTHATVVSTGHGDTRTKIGAKKKPAPMNHAEPARSHTITSRSQRGM
ncbi:hypothetical protein H7K09_19460 [Mycolicibacterium duvalii]|uniref:Uncharacterized protein n=1 Tax=Mycolicibacterium duvalii TaxID=39688 RepID=A0A7I7JX33_9MYCO|nr:hypothetical protein [Mycolicibacterium duvalii]MCV7369626.1 hypothetical protein [Mycolicibacterium duvalii]BBX16353.1 hypothetical protein MDUV_12130 [Mycolicibacterium duvalii]